MMCLPARTTSGITPSSVNTDVVMATATSVIAPVSMNVRMEKLVTVVTTVSSTSGTPSLVRAVVTTLTTASVMAKLREIGLVSIHSNEARVAVRIASTATATTFIRANCVAVTTATRSRGSATTVS